jgi:hypothetical protein
MTKMKKVADTAKYPATLVPVNRKVPLDTLLQHETLTEEDIAKEENLGVVPNKDQPGFLLSESSLSGHTLVLSAAEPASYTITQKGIGEGIRLGGLSG